MLMEAIDEKKLFLESHLRELKAKYGVAEDKLDDVIVVPKRHHLGPPGRRVRWSSKVSQ